MTGQCYNVAVSVISSTDVNNHRHTAMLECRRVGNIVTDGNNYRDTAMLTCHCVGNIVTDINNHRDTAMLTCRRVGDFVTDVTDILKHCRVAVNIDVSDNVTDTAIY